MTLPFTARDFFGVFGQYNEAMWPAPWLLTAVAGLVLLAASRPTPRGSRSAALGLALFWFWMGVVYHWIYFTEINPAAWLFGSLFLIQSGLLFWLGAIRAELRFRWPGGWKGGASASILSYSLVVYPILNRLFGHHFPETPTFGLPCPTTIFTLGVLLWLRSPYPKAVFLIPWIWAVVGGSAAFILGVPQDLGLLVAGLVSVGFVWSFDRSLRGGQSAS